LFENNCEELLFKIIEEKDASPKEIMIKNNCEELLFKNN